MPPEPLSSDRKERKHDRSSESLGSTVRWRGDSSYHGSREFYRGGSAEFRRPTDSRQLSFDLRRFGPIQPESAFDPASKKHKVSYNDGDEEMLSLKTERFELIEDDSGSDGEQASDHPSPDASTETPLKKKAKRNSNETTKQGKMDSSLKKQVIFNLIRLLVLFFSWLLRV
ncbi:hypothetical protein CMV_014043 [Castanea mollissima]|uniref:Uncharacterized protein n=1 Tax=Castanea mollissima TaxID=60419 RepID=A0A8J4VUA1_9ROSI|nr:hypothetical protein CMV_014043 [Castanea mollissima]